MPINHLYHTWIQQIRELRPDQRITQVRNFGPWEQIFYGELDGQRAKRVLVKIIGE